jgi:para-aminobenzoate synthetase component 1
MTTGTLARDTQGVLCRAHFKRAGAAADLAAVSELFSRLDNASIIGGNSAKKDAGRFSYWAAEPIETFELKSNEKDALERLQQILDKYKLEVGGHENAIREIDNTDENSPGNIFCGGWIGYFSYELGRHIEPTVFAGPPRTTDDLDMPLIRLCFYDRLICYDHFLDAWWLIALELPNDTEGPSDKIAGVAEILMQAEQVHTLVPRSANLDDIDFSSICCNMDMPYYLEAIEKIRRYIYDGDVYQINFSQRFECDYAARSIELFHWQNQYNPSGYAAYIDAGNFQIISASPEMFITVSDGVISTKPIKGTRRRLSETGPNDARVKKINADNFDQLAKSEKEQAELNMIIDLERNDVARICKSGTRKVTQPRTIESYPTVFHAVATVGGQLRGDVSFCDILKAMFPGGSITGAPKIRAMEIIEETEPTARGVYTGSIGYIGIDGSVCLNIAIRTMIIKNRKVFAQTGGGIVADSDPQAEWDETNTKARALLAGMMAAQKGH